MIIGLIGGGRVEGNPELRYPTLAQGKDTAALTLAEFGYKRVAFADNLKNEVAAAFRTTFERLDEREFKQTPQEYLALRNCVNDEFVACVLKVTGDSREVGLDIPRSPRQITQWWGTEYRRMLYSDDYWLQAGLRSISGAGNYVITDVRLPNEAEELRKRGVILVRMVRPGTEVPLIGDEHFSEVALLDFPCDATLVNQEGDFEGLADQVKKLVQMQAAA